MKLTLERTLKAGKRRKPWDLRSGCYSVVASYRGEDGHEYRKEFILPTNTPATWQLPQTLLAELPIHAQVEGILKPE